MACSTSSTDRSWLPPPETWESFACRRCSAEVRCPFPPSDGRCAACRKSEAEAVGKKAVEELLAEAGAPPRYAELTRASWERRFTPWPRHPQLRHLVSWPWESDSWLLLITSAGHGERKTGLATAVLGEALEHGLAGHWSSQASWLRSIKASWAGGSGVEPESAVWSRVAEAPVLLFDELGGLEADGSRRSSRSWWRQQVTELLHYRESHRLPTIVTARMTDWRRVGDVHPSLVRRMDVPLKIALPSRPSSLTG